MRSVEAPDNLCAYCGLRPATTSDHVFSKCLFAKPYPNNLLTVPTCLECNGGTGDGNPRKMTLDEEYFRTCLVSERSTDANPVAVRLRDGPVMKSFDRSRGFMTGFASQIGPVWYQESSGAAIYTGLHGYRPDVQRMNRVLRKIAKGLAYRHTSRRIPFDHVIECFMPVSAADFDQTSAAMLRTNQIVAEDYRSLNAPVIEYAGAITPYEGSSDSIWLIMFYGCIRAALHIQSPTTQAIMKQRREAIGG